MTTLMETTIQKIMVLELYQVETTTVDLTVTNKYQSLLELQSSAVRIMSGCGQEAFSA